MIRTRFKKVLLVAPDIFQNRLLAEYKDVKHIASIKAIFPSLYQLNPDMVIFDYDYIGEDLEKILRRIHTNKFYDKLKICCYKSTPDEKTDDLLKTLGVDYLISREDMVRPNKSRGAFSFITEGFDKIILSLAANVQ